RHKAVTAVTGAKEFGELEDILREITATHDEIGNGLNSKTDHQASGSVAKPIKGLPVGLTSYLASTFGKTEKAASAAKG
ncbi:MAG: hypothetical protein RMJ19_12740, partial [Gemmatales bacterium]|nr:hypothetical protein [Gemmatales bacterium]MDW8176534.1 hypothetical protein [Gemmatales bacterium]